MKSSKPAVFVDAIASGMFYLSPPDRRVQGHDAFPVIAEFIKDFYFEVAEVQGVRIYKRRPDK